VKESRILEYKSEITNTFLKTVSAYANFGTGEIYFGVNDDGSICGINNPDHACLDIENRINDNIKPKPKFTFSINRRTNVIALIVTEGHYKPYLYKGKAYRRSNTASIEVDQIELKRLVLEGNNMYYEELPYRKENLQFQTLAQKFKEKLNIKDMTDDILRTLGFYTENLGYNNAAALFADKNNFYGIDIVRFGNTINEILDRETVTGISVLKQYDVAVELYRKYYQYEKIEGINRKLIELIPEDAFREGIANALVHRVWDVNSHTRVSMYSDRIEITSPGGLPKGLIESEYLNGYISNLRNPIIGNVFFRLHYIEMFGTGIRRILNSYTDFKIKPKFIITDNTISVSLPVITATYQITSDEKVIIKALSSGVYLASSEIVNITGLGKDKVIRLLNSLIKKNYVKIRGKGRGTKYMMNSGVDSRVDSRGRFF